MNLDESVPAPALTLGPFRVGVGGTLEPLVCDPAPGFTCRWRDRTIHARLLRGDNADWRLELRAPLTRMPSSVRALDAARRPPTFTLLHGLPALLPDGWHVGLAADHRVMLKAERHASLPMTATGLVGELTLFLLELGPYLDLLDEAGLPGLPEPVGTANT